METPSFVKLPALVTWCILVTCLFQSSYAEVCYLRSHMGYGGCIRWFLPAEEVPNCTSIKLGGYTTMFYKQNQIIEFDQPFISDNSDEVKEILEKRDSRSAVCPTNMKYGNCSCQATCENPRNENECNNTCTEEETCVCPDGFLMKGDNCVPEVECDCYMEGEGVVEDGGIFINSNCSRCSCNSNQLICEDALCNANATCREVEGAHQCECNGGFIGDGQSCVVGHTDCLDLYNAGITTDGVYTIHPSGWGEAGFEVYCEMESNDAGWTVIQRRVNGSVDFYRNWTEYRNGFGTLDHEFWLGNENIYQLTNQTDMQLRIDISNDGGRDYALYHLFRIGSEKTDYKLIELGTFDNGGVETDALKDHVNAPFSTHDRDMDLKHGENCAVTKHGGWWFTGCHTCYLNGVFGKSSGPGIRWYNLPGGEYNIKSTEMKIRPAGP